MTDVVLRDGSTVRIRPATAADEHLVQDYFVGLSDESRRLRFWAQSVDVTEAARRTVDVDGVDHLTLIATLGAEGQMIGGAQFIRVDTTARAEVALSVTDEFQGHGLGSILVGMLAQAATAQGIGTFVAEVLPENHRMIGVFRDSGFLVTIRREAGRRRGGVPDRDHRGDDRAVRGARALSSGKRRPIVPAAVVVRGDRCVPRSGNHWRAAVPQPRDAAVRGGGLPGEPVAPHVQGVTAYPRIEDVPGRCRRRLRRGARARRWSRWRVPAAPQGVRALVVICAGFAEAGPEGAARQRELVEVCRRLRDAPRRAELHGRREHRSRCEAERDVRDRVAAGGTRGVPVAVRRARARRDETGRGDAHGPVDVRERRQQGGRLRPTTCSATGTRIRAPTWCSCTWSRSGTRGGSAGSRGGSPGTSRSSP